MSLPRIYLAGPDVFFRNPRALAEEMKAILRRHQLDGTFPLDNFITAVSPEETAREIFLANCLLIDQCDAVLANITPFRGPSADVGTAWEMGYAFAQGKPIVAYTENLAHYPEKVFQSGHSSSPEATHDHQGHDIENFRQVDNLMLTQASTAILPSLEEAAKYLNNYFKNRGNSSRDER